MGSPLGRNAWLSTALLCIAMLILPAVGWVLFPKRSPPPRASAGLQTSLVDPAPTVVPTSTFSRTTSPATAQLSPDRPSPSEAPSTPVSGVVLDPDGKPVAGALVS